MAAQVPASAASDFQCVLMAQDCVTSTKTAMMPVMNSDVVSIIINPLYMDDHYTCHDMILELVQNLISAHVPD